MKSVVTTSGQGQTGGEGAIVLTDILGSEDALGDMDFKVHNTNTAALLSRRRVLG